MNIVSIDFDIIMHRSINIYNDLVDDETSIQNILDENKEACFIPRSDLFLYNYLTNFILKCCQKLSKDNIIFIDDHHQIVDYFDSGVIQGDNDFNIFNIDFHHDIAYSEGDVENKVEELDCGNWIKYLFEHYSDNFKQYVWINTEESSTIDDRLMTFDRIYTYNIKKYNLDALIKSADILFICKSVPWVPLEEQQLYDTWIDTVDFLYKK